MAESLTAVGGAARMCTRRLARSITKNAEPLERTRVGMEQVAGEDAASLRSKELRPGGSGSLGRGARR